MAEGFAFGIPRVCIVGSTYVGLTGDGVGTIKRARYFEMDSHDVPLTPLTESMDLYELHNRGLREDRGPYSRERVARTDSR